MKAMAEVLIIGGGVTGSSIAYHLAKKGCRNVILCEKHEFASGATAFAAGHVILYTLNLTISRLNQYSVELYKRLEAETGMSPGFHRCGNLRLATHQNRFDEFIRYLGIAQATGIDARMVSTKEIGALWPLLTTEGVLGGLYNPGDGHIGPTDLAQSLAAGARQNGAKLYRNREVTKLSQERDGSWRVETTQGDILARHVVSASGNYAQSIARMVGLTAQSIPVRHQYMVTEPIELLRERRLAGMSEMPVMRDPEGSFYCRQEGDALVVGAYDGRGETRFVYGSPSGMAEPFADEIEKLLPYLEGAMERIPTLSSSGVRRVVNYAMPYTPDDLPTVGPAPGHRNLWLAEGTPFGITLAGGIGWQMAEWILEGVPSLDMSCCDARRFGEWATREWSARKVEEAYEHTYLLPKPGEEMPAARELRTSPIHDLLAARGARFGVVAGWERPTWFAPDGVEDAPSFYRPNWHDSVGAECRAATTGAVLADVSHVATFRLSGADAPNVLEGLLGVTLPGAGCATGAFVLSATGGIDIELSVGREGTDRFLLTASASEELQLSDVLQKASTGSETLVDNLTGAEGALLLFGVSAEQRLRDVLANAEEGDSLEPGALKQITIGYAPVRAHRCDPFGMPGYRLHVRADMLRHVFLRLESGVTLVGSRALESLRLERGQPAWPDELNIAVTPAMAAGNTDVYPRIMHLEIDGAETMPHGLEPIRDGTGRIVGRTTSAGWGHLRNKALALALVDNWERELEVCVMGNWQRAVQADGAFAGADITTEERRTA